MHRRNIPELLSSGRNELAVKFVPVECFYSNSISGRVLLIRAQNSRWFPY